MYLTSTEGYKNAGVDILRIRKPGEYERYWRWLGVKNMSDLVLKEIHGIFEKKKITK